MKIVGDTWTVHSHVDGHGPGGASRKRVCERPAVTRNCGIDAPVNGVGGGVERQRQFHERANGEVCVLTGSPSAVAGAAVDPQIAYGSNGRVLTRRGTVTSFDGVGADGGIADEPAQRP